MDDSKWGDVAESLGRSIGLSEFKLTTPLRQVGLGRIVALYCHSSTSYQIHEDNRYLCF